MQIHASAVARDGDAVLLLGPPGSGKSDLVLRLLREGWGLVADDQVALTAAGPCLLAAAPAALWGLLEVRGLGIFRDLPVAEDAPVLRLAAEMAPPAAIPRLPEPERWEALGASVPLIKLAPFEASATARLGFALDAARGARRQVAGAFA